MQRCLDAEPSKNSLFKARRCGRIGNKFKLNLSHLKILYFQQLHFKKKTEPGLNLWIYCIEISYIDLLKGDFGDLDSFLNNIVRREKYV